VLSGEELVSEWVPDEGFAKCFCSVCGSALWSRHPRSGAMSVRLGTLDGDPGIRPQWHQFVAYASAWEPVPDDGLPRYPEGKPPTYRLDVKRTRTRGWWLIRGASRPGRA